MSRHVARQAHAAATLTLTVAAVVTLWTWNVATRPIRWVAPLTDPWKDTP